MWHAFGSSDPNCVSYSGIPYYYATLLQSYSYSCTVLDAYAFYDSHSWYDGDSYCNTNSHSWYDAYANCSCCAYTFCDANSVRNFHSYTYHRCN